jgi:hypothetical protein
MKRRHREVRGMMLLRKLKGLRGAGRKLVVVRTPHGPSVVCPRLWSNVCGGGWSHKGGHGVWLLFLPPFSNMAQ